MNNHKKAKYKKIKVQLIILFAFLLIIETCLRISHRPGTLESSIYPLDSVQYTPLFKGDSLGITSYIKNSEILPKGYIINNDGFRSSFSFDKKTIDSFRIIEHKKIIFLIGDSYTAGCCVEDIKDSFADLLSQKEKYCILNFGISSTDLVQYKLIIDKYVKLLKPDLVLTLFYLGNDITKFDRPIVPNIPLTYTIKNYPWIKSIKLPWHTDDSSLNYFKSSEEAYNFYISKYTLWGKDRSIFEKVIRHSVLFSKIYLGIQEKYHQIIWKRNHYSVEKNLILTNDLLHDIKSVCLSYKIGLSIIGIPSPKDAIKQIDLNKKYGKYFQGINHDFPEISLFSKKNYDGPNTNNHFNESGHQIFSKYLEDYLEKKYHPEM